IACVVRQPHRSHDLPMSFEQQSGAGLLATASFGQCFGRAPYQIRAALMGVFSGSTREGAGLSIQFSFSSLVIHSLQEFLVGFRWLAGSFPRRVWRRLLRVPPPLVRGLVLVLGLVFL